MTHRVTIVCIIFCAFIFSGCGTGKKLEAAQTESETLRTQVAGLEKEVAQYKSQVSGLTSQNTSLTQEYSQYKKDCQLVQEKYNATQAILTNEAEMLEAVEDKLVGALADFKDKGVEVEYKNGYVFVSMADELLYKTGSAVPGPKAADALGPVATVLNDYPNLKVIVLGNTDDVKYKKGATDNWSLSTERANGVLRILRDKYSIDPARLTSAGKGMYNPVADNSTADGKAKNRRTDIILNPDLDKIWRSVQK